MWLLIFGEYYKLPNEEKYEVYSEFDWIQERSAYEKQYALFKKIAKLRGKNPVMISS